MVLLRSIATVGSYTMVSRILGFARDILIAALLGAGPVADAFFVAFKLPNLFRRMFAEGACNAAFIPLFTARLTEDGRDAARRFAEEVFAILALTLIVFCTVIQIGMPWAMHIFAPGFYGDPEKFDLAVELTRITFPYLLFISLVSQLSGILNSLGRFAAAAATPNHNTVPTSARASALGLLNMTFSIGSMLGPPIGGYVADRVGLPMVFKLMGVFGLVAAVAFQVGFRNEKPPL